MLASSDFSNFHSSTPPRARRRRAAIAHPAASSRGAGIYRRHFTAAECKMLDATDPADALSEICLVRVLLTRLMAAAQRKRRLSLKDHVSLLSAISAAGANMASLVRFQLKANPFDPLSLLDDLDPWDL